MTRLILEDPILIEPVIDHIAEIIAPNCCVSVGEYMVTVVKRVGAEA